MYIEEEGWVRLVTAVYYGKFSKFFRSKGIGQTYDLTTRHPHSPEAQRNPYGHPFQ